MESITEQDAYFLVALNASEESSLTEVKCEFETWDHRSFNVGAVIENLIKDGTILLSEREGENFSDYSAANSITLAAKWETSESWNTILFLTETGERRWETDDWGITSKRAQHLMFSNKSGVTRAQ